MPPKDFIVTDEWKISQIYKLVHAALILYELYFATGKFFKFITAYLFRK